VRRHGSEAELPDVPATWVGGAPERHHGSEAEFSGAAMGRTPCELDRRGMRDWDEFRRCWAHAEEGALDKEVAYGRDGGNA
jgi:hypothetical protein